MSFHKASKKDEQDLKEYSKAKDTPTETEEQPAKTDVKGLQEALEGKEDSKGVKKGGKDVSFATFKNADENWRKRALKEDYAELKLKYGWLYDQPIE